MVNDDSIALLHGLLRFAPSFTTQAQYTTFSMEQLWLAFVMKDKYDKTWDGKEWKKP